MKTRFRTSTRLLGCSMLLVAALALPAAVRAQVAYTTQAVNIRAGPDREYPQVAWLPSGVPVTVIGCVDGWRWCDVVAGPNRGWVYAKFLAYPYQNQPVPIISGGAILGLPLVTFSIGPYWDNYYRGRPWYGNRSYWYNRPTPYYRPPPPRYQPVPPHRPPGYVPPPQRPPGGRPPGSGPPPNTGQPPGGRPPSGGPPPSGGGSPGGVRSMGGRPTPTNPQIVPANPQ